MKTPTPETDANAETETPESPFAPTREWVHASFARKLERERDAAFLRIEEIQIQLTEALNLGGFYRDRLSEYE